MSDIQVPALKSAINRRLDMGCATLTAKEVTAVIRDDPALGMLLLRQWQGRGWVHVERDSLAANPEWKDVAMKYADQKLSIRFEVRQYYIGCYSIYIYPIGRFRGQEPESLPQEAT